VAIYEQVVEDAQRTVYLVQPQGPVSLTGNVEEATTTGLEFDSLFSLTEWLDIGFGYAHTNARFTEPYGDVVGYPHAFGPYADAPKDTYTFYFAAEHQLDGIGILKMRGDFYHTTGTYFSNLANSIGPGTEVDGYDLANFRVSLEEIAGSSLSASAYVRNAFGEEYIRGGLPLAGSIGTNGTIPGEPRTAGVELTYNF
jgi:iron complex outermembrane receptor protein